MNNTRAVPANPHFLSVNNHPDRYVEAAFAASAVNAASISLGIRWEEAYTRLLQAAHERCLMPADPHCVRDMLQSFGFVLQPGNYAGGLTVELLRRVCSERFHEQEIVLAQTLTFGSGGRMTVLMPGENGQYLAAGTNDMGKHRVDDVWIRWSDGQNHSEVKRRRGNGSFGGRKRQIPPDHLHYRYYNANPQNRYIGDCLLRAIAVAADVGWHGALDMLGTSRRAIINDNDSFREILEGMGFRRRCVTMIGSRFPTVCEFCRQMQAQHTKGEPVIAYVGTSHVAAVMPYRNERDELMYRAVDTWDCTSRPVEEYWVNPVLKRSDFA